jgi:hypothetical protein
MSEQNVVKVIVKEKDMVVVKGAIIKSVSSPSTIQRVAVDKGVNPQEVFVRVNFEHGGKLFQVSNKLKFLTKAGYNELIDAQKNATPMQLAVDKNSGFFYIEKDISVDDLFKTPVQSNNRADLSALFA